MGKTATASGINHYWRQANPLPVEPLVLKSWGHFYIIDMLYMLQVLLYTSLSHIPDSTFSTYDIATERELLEYSSKTI